MKKCTKCNVVKHLCNFMKDKHNKTGLTCVCKSCKKEQRQSKKEYFKNYRKINSIKLKNYSKNYRENNKEALKIKYLEKLTDEKIKIKNQYSKKYHQDNKEKIVNYKKEYSKLNEEKIKCYQKKYREKTKDKKRVYMYFYIKEREKNDILFKIKRSILDLISKSIKGKGYKKKSRAHKLLGCDFETFRKYIESKFKDGMTWENKGNNGWHIDHIYPNSLCKTEEELYKNQHYTNLQPLWKEENLKKSNKVIKNL